MNCSERTVRLRVESVEGLKVVDIEKGKHYKVRIRTPNGKHHLFIMSISPSDHRVPAKQISQLRRLLRENAA